MKQTNEETRKSFDLAAEKYFELFKDEMKQKEYDRALLVICDVGCGSGHVTRYLFDKGLNVFGIDISEKCIQIARRENPKMRFQVMDMARLDITDESLDGIVSFILLYTLQNDLFIYCSMNSIECSRKVANSLLW